MAIDLNHSSISIARQCELLGLGRRSAYYRRRCDDTENEQIIPKLLADFRHLTQLLHLNLRRHQLGDDLLGSVSLLGHDPCPFLNASMPNSLTFDLDSFQGARSSPNSSRLGAVKRLQYPPFSKGR